MLPLTRLWERAPVPTAIAATYVALLICSGPNLIDPMIRHDDFPALLGDETLYYEKTLLEGRWINYLWHLRGVVTPSWLNFLVYQLFWAVFAACTAIAVFGRDAPVGRVLALALLIVLAPTAFVISLWYNTLIPGLGIVALFAYLATRYPPHVMRWLLPVFVPVTLLCYTTYPVLLLMVVLGARNRDRSLKDLAVTLGVFIASFAAGMLLIYGLNYVYHGVFGVPMAQWRNPRPIEDLAGLWHNLGMVLTMFGRLANVLSFKHIPLLIIMASLLSCAVVIVWRSAPRFGLYVAAGCAAGLGLLSLHVLKTGVDVDPRAAIFVSVGCAMILSMAMANGIDQGLVTARRAQNAMFVAIALHAVLIAVNYSLPRAWQADTRAFARAAGPGTGPIYVTGDYEQLPSAKGAAIQKSRGLRLRLVYLTGREVIICQDHPEACQHLPQTGAGQTQLVQHTGDGTVLALPVRVAQNGG